MKTHLSTERKKHVRLPYIILISIVIFLMIIGGFFALNSYIYQQKQAKPSNVILPYRGTLTGEYVCLPHTDTSGPQTLECALGMRTETGEYYALDFNLLSQGVPNLVTGNRFTATGTITPVETLSTNQWQKYPIQGIFSVTDAVKKL